MSDKESIKKCILEEIPNIKGIYIFGSKIDDTSNSESDWDIAILLHHTEKLNIYKLDDIRSNLSVILKSPVDLVDLIKAPIIFRAEIVSTADRIFCSDYDYCELFETTTYSMYTKYCEEIEGNLEEIKKQGFIKYSK